LKIILILTLFFIGSCQKQSPSDLAPDYVDSLSEIKRGEACRRVDLLQNIVEIENVRDLFVCTTWNESFPALFSALEKVNKDDWNKFATPLNKHVFNDTELRDKLISLISELDKRNGLDELAKVITSLSDSNFFYHVNKLLGCALKKENCLEGQSLSPDDLWSFFSFFKMPEEVLENFSNLIRSFSFSFKAEGGAFVRSLTSNLGNPDFKEARNDFINQIFLRMGDNDFKEEMSFYKRVILDEYGEKGWLPTHIENNFDRDEFVYLVRYPVDTHREMWKDFKILEKSLSTEILCSRQEQPTFSVNISKHLNEFVDLLFANDQSDFFRTSLQSIAILKAAKEICPNLLSYGAYINTYEKSDGVYHEINFISLMEKTTSLLLEPDYFHFAQRMQSSGTMSEKDNLFLLRYFSSDLFASFVDMIRATTAQKDDLTSSIYDVFNSLPDAFYRHLFKAITFVLEKDDQTLRSMSQTWKSLGSEGQFFFFNFLDQHYTKSANITLLFDFYSEVISLSKDKLSLVLEEFFLEREKEGLLNSLYTVTAVLAGEKLLDDYRTFFSRDHIIEILKIVSRGSVSQDIVANVLGSYVFEKKPLDDVRISSHVIPPTTTQRCLTRLVDSSVSFYDLINDLPEACTPFGDSDPFFKFFLATNDMAKALQQPLSDIGIFSPGMIKTTTLIANSISKRFSSGDEEGLSVALESFKDWVKTGSRKNDLINSISIANLFVGDDVDFIETITRFYGQNENFMHLNKVFSSLPVFMQSYDDYRSGKYDSILTPSSYVRDERFDCENYHQKVGGVPCPNKTQLKEIVQRVIRRVLKKNDKNPKAIEQLLKMVAAGHGLPIPYESNNPRIKRVTLRESFEMFHKFTNRDIQTNQFELEYGPIPMADLNYFETEDWEVDRRQVKGAPDPYKINLNTMERIEVVIRDVRFDQNYLGAHYLNSVAKAEDYNKTVESKNALLKTCVPLKFCGKFMDKAQHRFAKNSKETFLSLLDVNTKEDWRFGDYMQALLMSLVSSSPDKSQISSVVNRRFLGLNIQIPWLNSKKDLVDHNGKILGLVSMVGMFTNSARLLKDRVGRSPEEFLEFLNGERLKRTDDALFRNFRDREHLPALEDLLSFIKDSSFLDSFLDYAYGASYDQQRLWEQVLFKGIYLSSYLASEDTLNSLDEGSIRRYKDLSILDYLNILKSILESHEEVSQTWDFKSKENLLSINHFLDVTLKLLEDGDQNVSLAIHELAFFLRENEVPTKKLLKSLLEKEKISSFKEKLSSIQKLAKELSSNDGLFLRIYKHLENDSSISWTALQEMLEYNGAPRICSEVSEGYNCRRNPSYREIQKVLVYLLRDGAAKLDNLFNYITGPQQSKINEIFKKIFPSINNETR
jgi:hypothetical protein